LLTINKQQSHNTKSQDNNQDTTTIDRQV